jgi:hypothetical protein
MIRYVLNNWVYPGKALHTSSTALDGSVMTASN